jgi:septal ring factor EnvC (AmiA/AmiB activator)
MPADFGSGRGDDHLMRIGHVLPAAYVEAVKLQHAIDDYDRDILAGARARVAWSERDVGKIDQQVSILKAQLRSAQNEQESLRAALTRARADLAEAESARPTAV